MAFKDYFSKQSSHYTRYRPHYPAGLFDYLAQYCPGNVVALDCATGSGQAAVQLAKHFDKVLACDASLAQLQHAQACNKVNYLCSEAEFLPLMSNSLDLITVAQAVHWFDREIFYAEAHRTLKPAGILALWCYGLFKTESEIDVIIDDYYNNTLAEYWPDERKQIEQGYHELDFPYPRRDTPPFYIEANWSLDDVIGYLQTWSATQRYIDANAVNPLPALETRLQQHWPAGTNKQIQWPVYLLMGTKA